MGCMSTSRQASGSTGRTSCRCWANSPRWAGTRPRPRRQHRRRRRRACARAARHHHAAPAQNSGPQANLHCRMRRAASEAATVTLCPGVCEPRGATRLRRACASAGPAPDRRCRRPPARPAGSRQSTAPRTGPSARGRSPGAPAAGAPPARRASPPRRPRGRSCSPPPAAPHPSIQHSNGHATPARVQKPQTDWAALWMAYASVQHRSTAELARLVALQGSGIRHRGVRTRDPSILYILDVQMPQ